MKTSLKIIGAALIAVLAATTSPAGAASSPFVVFPPKMSGDNTAIRRPGSHYDILVDNQMRQCSRLAAAHHRVEEHGGANIPAAAQALHARGLALCSQGDRAEGIVKLTAALHGAGAWPLVY